MENKLIAFMHYLPERYHTSAFMAAAVPDNANPSFCFAGLPESQQSTGKFF